LLNNVVLRCIIYLLSFTVPILFLSPDHVESACPVSKIGNSEYNRWVQQTLPSLSLEEKIGQMLQVRAYGDYADFNDLHYRSVSEQIQRYHVGSIDLAARMRGPNLVKGRPSDVARILNDLQQSSKLPLLIAADLERGLASRLSAVPEFPFPMAFGAVADTKIVSKFAAVTAQEARKVGIHWAYSPDADVNSNPGNPIINTRSFGEDPTEVGRLVAAYIKGAHENGMLTTAKHFPGHGDSSTDSHIGLVRIDSDRSHMDRYELPPFKNAIGAGVDSIMLAHAAVPALDSDPTRIATNSRQIIKGLLQDELGFKGLVVTDALEMRAVMSLYPREADPSGVPAPDPDSPLPHPAPAPIPAPAPAGV